MFELIQEWLAGSDVALSRALNWLLGNNVRADREFRSEVRRFANLAWRARRDRTVFSLSRAVKAWLKIRTELVVRGKLDLLFHHLPQDWKDLEKELLGTEWWYPVVLAPDDGWLLPSFVRTAVGPRCSTADQARTWWRGAPEAPDPAIQTRLKKYQDSHRFVARWDRGLEQFFEEEKVE